MAGEGARRVFIVMEILEAIPDAEATGKPVGFFPAFLTLEAATEAASEGTTILECAHECDTHGETVH